MVAGGDPLRRSERQGAPGLRRRPSQTRTAACMRGGAPASCATPAGKDLHERAWLRVGVRVRVRVRVSAKGLFDAMRGASRTTLTLTPTLGLEDAANPNLRVRVGP